MRKESDTPPKRRRFALGPSPNRLRVKSTGEGGIVGLYRTVLASRYSRTQALWLSPTPLSAVKVRVSERSCFGEVFDSQSLTRSEGPRASHVSHRTHSAASRTRSQHAVGLVGSSAAR